jgi:DNA-binding NarL/FixJ family response regulator
MPGARPSQIPPGAEDWPLIGRDRELAELAAAHGDPRLHGAVLVGAAGAGRSRLLREAADAARAQGDHVESVHATRSAATVPLGALVALVPDAAGRDDVLSLMRACVEALHERAGGRSAVLAVDDAQLLDPASAALVLHLAGAGAAFVVATVRAGDPCPDAIASLWKDGTATRVELPRLRDDEIRALLEAMLGGPVEQAAAQWAIEASGGNAVYLRELARGAVESGALRRLDGLWTIAARPSPSASLLELVRERLADLGAAERDVVELLALGEPLSADEVAALGVTEPALAAEARGVLTTAPDGIRLAHPLLGESVRASLPELRARTLRTRLVGALERRRPSDGGEALRLARLRLEAGAAVGDELSLRAARAANRAGDPELGAELAELALAGDGGLEAAMALAQARRQAGRRTDAAAILASAERLAPGDPGARAYVRERIGLLYWELRRPDEVRAFLDRIAGWSADRAWQDFVAGLGTTYSGLAEGLGDIAAAERIATNESLPEDPRRLGAVAHRLGLLLAGDGDRAANGAFGDLPGPALSDEADIAALATLVLVAIETGQRWDELELYLTRVMHDAARARVREAAGIAALGIARLQLLRGRYREASRWLVEAEVHLSRRDPYNAMIGVRCTAVGIACFSGDYETAAAAHERLESWAAAHAPLTSQRPLIARAGAWVQGMRSPAAAGRRLLADAESFAGELPGLAPALAYDALRAGDHDAAELLERLAAPCRARIVTAYAGHGSARAARDGGALLAVADEMAAIGALRYAVEAASEAATVFVAQGRDDSARRAAARARDLHAPGQDAPLPTIDGLDAAAVELTPREAQLIELARQGLSNAQIAERLVISVRTAETHLYRGMQKLGVSDRRDL